MEPKTTVKHNSVAYYQAHEDAYIASLAKGPPRGLPFNMTYRFPADYKFQGMSRLLEMAHNLLKVSSCKFPQHPHVAGDIYSDVYYDDGYFFRLHIFIFKNDFCQIAEFYSPSGFYPNIRTRYYSDDLSTALIPDNEGGHTTDSITDCPRHAGDVAFFPMPVNLDFHDAINCDAKHFRFLKELKYRVNLLSLNSSNFSLHWNHLNYVVATNDRVGCSGVRCHFYNCNGKFAIAWNASNDEPDVRLRRVDYEWLTRDSDTGRNYAEMTMHEFIGFNEFLRARYPPAPLDYHKMSNCAEHIFTTPRYIEGRAMCFYYHQYDKTCYKLLLTGPVKHNSPKSMYEAFDLYTQLMDLNFVKSCNYELQNHSSLRTHQYWWGNQKFYHVLHAGFGRNHVVVLINCTTSSFVPWIGDAPNMLLPFDFWKGYRGFDANNTGMDFQALGELSAAAMAYRVQSSTDTDHQFFHNYAQAIKEDTKFYDSNQLTRLKLKYDLFAAGAIHQTAINSRRPTEPIGAREAALRNVLRHLSVRGAIIECRDLFGLELMAFHTESDIVAAQYCPLCRNKSCLHHAHLASAFARFYAPLKDFAFPWSQLACGKLDDINEIQRCSVCHLFGCGCAHHDLAQIYANLNTAVKYHPNRALALERPGPVNRIWMSLVYPYKRMSLHDLAITSYNRAAVADMLLSEYYALCERHCTAEANWDGYTIMLPYYTAAHRVSAIPHIPCLKYGDHGFHIMFITYETDMAAYCRGLVSDVVDTSIVTSIPRWYPLEIPEVD